MLRKTQRRAWKALSRARETLAVAPPVPEAAFSPEGTAGVPPVAARRGPGVSTRGLHAALGGGEGESGGMLEGGGSGEGGSGILLFGGDCSGNANGRRGRGQGWG